VVLSGYLFLEGLFMTDMHSHEIPDLQGETGRELHYTVPSEFSSAIHLRVQPLSVCRVGVEGDSERHLTLIADSQGIVQFHVNAVETALDFVRLAVESDAIGTVSRYAIDLRLGREPTKDMPSPPRPVSLSWTGEDRLRNPLSLGDMLSMPEERLLEQRYPIRPSPDEAPRAFEIWRRAVMAPAREVDSVLVERPGVTHGLAQAGPSSRPNWSGFELRASRETAPGGGGGPHYDWVTGTWRVPHVVGHIPGSDYSNMWVGIDGDDTSDLWQAGTEQDVATSSLGNVTFTIASYYAWSEFIPQEQFEKAIPNFPVEPGDEIFACVWIGDEGSAPKLDGAFGFTYIQNFRTGDFALFPTPRGGTSVGGTEAEWIVERPLITPPGGGSPFLPPLADYGRAVMSGAYARLAGSPFGKGYLNYQGGMNLQLTMLAGGAVLSTVRPLDEQSMEFRWGDPRTLPVSQLGPSLGP
jgi:hypothetical protein